MNKKEMERMIKKGDVVTLQLLNGDGFWTPDKEYTVKGISDYSVHFMNSKNEFEYFKFDKYDTYWKITSVVSDDYSCVTDVVPESAPTGNVVVDIPEETTEDTVAEKISSPTEENNTDVPTEEVIESEDTKNNIEPIKEELTSKAKSKPVKEPKTPQNQRNASAKYDLKFERVNCRFEEGVIARIKNTEYKSVNKFIVAAVEEKLSGKASSTPVRNNLVAMPLNSGITQKFYNEIIDEINEREAFYDEEITAQDVLDILKKKITSF